jgi:hypothetical protein
MKEIMYVPMKEIMYVRSYVPTYVHSRYVNAFWLNFAQQKFFKFQATFWSRSAASTSTSAKRATRAEAGQGRQNLGSML